MRVALLLALAGSATAALTPSAVAPPAVVERRLVAMGTSLEISVSCATRARGLEASEAAARAIERAEGLLSTWRSGGPLAALNAAAPGVPVAVPPEVVRALNETFRLSEQTRGAFDPTVLPLVSAWGLRGGGRLPSPAEKARALAATGIGRFAIDAARGTVSRLGAASGIDEGAWGKGWALDRAAEALRAAGAAAAVLDLGGQVLAIGEASVGVAHPRARRAPVAVLGIADASVSTSGDSERSVEVGGRRVGHLLDPRTGEPAPDFGSVTVVAPSGFVADVLSTALFVLGPDEGPRVSEELRAAGVPHEALFLVDRGCFLEARTSGGAAALVRSYDTATVHGLSVSQGGLVR
jgi:thiamine biosynthesis lipoprotein